MTFAMIRAVIYAHSFAFANRQHYRFVIFVHLIKARQMDSLIPRTPYMQPYHHFIRIPPARGQIS
jgi:hypothetical protein